MKRLLLVFCLFFSGLLGADEKKDAPAMVPENLTLTNGAVLRKISVLKWTSDTVVIKHLGGVDRIRLTLIPPDILAAMKGAAAAAVAEESRLITLSGEVFVTTRGRSNVALGGTQVRVYRTDMKATVEAGIRKAVEEANNLPRDATLLDHQIKVGEGWNAMINSLPTPDISAYTDSLGKFSISVHANSYYCLVVVENRLAGGGDLERYAWVLPKEQIKTSEKIILGNFNMIGIE